MSIGPSYAASVILDFEGIAPYPHTGAVYVDQFYNGGTSSLGTSGTDYGVSFTGGATVLCLNTAGTNCGNSSKDGLGDPASIFNGLGFNTAGSHPINVAGGFDGSVGFSYAAAASVGTAGVYSGLNGTGTLLAAIDLSQNSGPCTVPDSDFCPFSPVTLSFSGVARSLVFKQVGLQPAVDDIVFANLLNRSSVPEPATWALMLVGVGVVGATLRGRRRVVVA